MRPIKTSPSAARLCHRVARLCHRVAIFSLIALIALCLAWEIFLAPLRPGGSWLMLKVLPLLLPLFGVLRGQRYTFQWSSMLILLYVSEGVVRAWSDRPPSSTLAAFEIVFSGTFFIAAICYAKFTALKAIAPERKTVAP